MRTFALHATSIIFINLLLVFSLATELCWSAPSAEYGDVELMRDAWGTAHVYSETDIGAMYGLGYACAEDRGFQIHYFLRIMQGRLAEVLGETSQVKRGATKTALENDRLMRAFGFARAAMDTGVRGTALAEKMSVIFRGGVYEIVAKYGYGVSGLARFAKATRRRFETDRDTQVLEDEAAFADSVLANAWKRCQRDYGQDPNTWRARAIQAQTDRVISYMASLDGFPGLDPEMDVHSPRLKTQDGSTVLSQKAQSYTQFFPLHDTDASLAILPPGPSEDPASPFRFSTYADWAQGKLHPAPLSRAAVERIMVRTRKLSEPPRRKARRELRPNRQPNAERKPLPGKKPDDPVLENAIRFLNRKERTQEEVVARITELREYMANDSAKKRELILGLELFTHLMSESQAGRLPIVYGTPETFRLAKRFYDELMDKEKTPPTRPRSPNC